MRLQNAALRAARAARVILNDAADPLHCAGCGARVATIRDTRFGLPPSASYCPSCTARAGDVDFPAF